MKHQIDKDALSSMIAEYLDTLDDEDDNECWGTEWDMSKTRLEEFKVWLYKEEDEKALRRQTYEQLKKEFAGETQAKLKPKN